ncbi:MAG: serine/threonine-protein kinase [Thermoanaerobaculia bacterium]
MSDSSSTDEITELFERALELESEARRQFVDSLAAREPELAAALVRLLDRAEDPDSPLDRSPWSEWLEAESPTGSIPERIGPYGIERELGRGGMGRVFLAHEETADFSRQLALKILDRPLADSESIRRFRDELRILSLLEHPGIARFLHGGRSPEGIWYLALEYVDGVDLITWAAEHELDRTARVRLFLSILEPVRYAHERGVVHRDLKPRHLLIDRQGRPRLLDFGISKLLVPGGEADLAITRTGARALTPAYAAPEQFRGEPVSPATDVFALGVVLYELLAGRRPFAASTRSAAAYEQAVLETEPDLSEALGDDLDAILRQALEKRPENRYRDAGELASDLERLLAGRPVVAQARRTGRRRRAAGRFLHGRRLALASGGVLVAALAAWLFWPSASDRHSPAGKSGRARASQSSPRPFPFSRLEASEIAGLERGFAAAPASLDAGAHLALALDQKRRLPEAKLIASRLRQIPGADGDPLLDYVDASLANSSDEPQRALVLFTSARDAALASGRGELLGQIRASRGRLLSTLGERQEAYREMDLARAHFESAGDFEALARVLNDLAIEHLIGGELAPGQDLLERSIEAARRAGSPPTLMLHNLGQLSTFRGDPARGEAMLREAVADRRRDGNPYRLGEVLAAHAEALDDLGRRPEAIANLDEAATMLRNADDKSALVGTLCLRGSIAVSAGELDRVEPLATELEQYGTQTGGYLGVISSNLLRGLSADARGDRTSMRREFGAAAQLAIAKGHLDFAAAIEAAYAAAELRAGDAPAAEAIASRALGRLPAGSATSAPMAVAQSILARVDAAAGRLDAARERLARFGDDASSSTSVSRRIALLSALAEIEIASGGKASTPSALGQALDLARRSGRRFEELELERNLAR